MSVDWTPSHLDVLPTIPTIKFNDREPHDFLVLRTPRVPFSSLLSIFYLGSYTQTFSDVGRSHRWLRNIYCHTANTIRN